VTDQDAGIWLRINSALKEEFKCWIAFTDDDADNIKTLVSHIRWKVRSAREAAIKQAADDARARREDRKIRKLASGCGLDAYDAEVQVREKRIMRQSITPADK
jgi:hypothetical protein